MPRLLTIDHDCRLRHILHSLEEVNIGKLLHLLHIDNLYNLLIVEQNPRCLLRVIAQRLADESYVMAERTTLVKTIKTLMMEDDSPCVDTRALMAYD